MKNSIKKFAWQINKPAFFTIIIFFICGIANAQLATYPLRTAHSSNNNTPPGDAQVSLTSPLVSALTNVPCASMYQVADNPYNGTGFRIKTRVSGTGVPWPGSIDNNFGFTIPISPVTGNDMNISNITLDVHYIDTDNPASIFTIVPYFDVDNSNIWQPLAGPQTANMGTAVPFTVNFGVLNETFYSGHTYRVRFYVFNTDGSDDGKNDEMRIQNLVFRGTVYQPIAQPVTVQTVSAAATGKYTASASGTYDFNGTNFYLVKKSGFIWSTGSAAALAALDTSAATKTTNGSAGVMSGPITGLTAGTTYWIKAYIVTQFGIQYGATLSFTTAAPTAPIVTTDPISNVLSNKATGGGVIVDSGGVNITSKGLVWNIAGGATLAANIGKVILNGNADPFTDFIKQLQPNTTYCYRAFATNSLGTSYGADVCFTTSAPVPVLTAIPGTIDFGQNFFGANAITVSYILTGAYLTLPSGTITINIPPTAGFQIASASAGPYSSSLSIPYTGSTLPRTPIFVRFPTGQYGSFSGSIIHSGGGTIASNADTVKLKGVIIQSPDDVTNRGNDFWLGFGYQNKMKQAAGSGTEPFLTVYVAAGSQPANVVVEMPGIPGAYYQTFTVPANSTHAFDNFPQGAVAGIDSRLSATGISNRAIHVYTTNGAPVSVWEYIATTGNSAGGSMVFPTSTWNSNYTVQAYAGKSNNGLPNSFFFAIANEDNTQVTITPSTGIISPAGSLQDNPAVLYPANVPFTVTLNRGQVFNAIGVITGSGNAATSAGFDLSGTTVSTKCDKKIAVFGGNGRCMVTTPTQCTEGIISAGSDNMIQQMIPSVAWDTKYFTVPTKTMEHNLFRIYVRSDTQDVWINDEAHGVPLLRTAGVHPGGADFNGYYTFQTFANGGGFYALETSDPTEIESEAPISVTQFITAGDCAANSNPPYTNPTTTGNNGQGDPEMIIITGAQQAITDAVVYSPAFQNGASGAGYINVVIPAAGRTTFRLDLATNPAQMVDTGASSYIGGQAYQNATPIPIANAFQPFPGNPAYLWAKFKVSYPTTHVMSSSVPFNATAYGVANGESYGFNAGTAVKNLSSYKISVNPEGTDSSSTVVRTCVNTPITLKLAFPYPPSLVNRVVWQPGNPNIIPSADTTGAVVAGVAVVDDTIVVGGRTFYVYKSPIPFTFLANGLYNFKVTAFGTFASDCPGEDQQTMLVNVGQDILNLAANPSCGNPLVPFTADTIPMVGTNILSWEWNFGDNTTVSTGAISPQNHTYPAGPTEFTVKLTTKNTVGCISTDSLTIDFGGGLESKFTIDNDSVCMNVPVTFTDASLASGTSGAISSWEWDFGNGNPVFNGQVPPPQSYTTSGIKTVSLTVRTPIGCVKVFKDTVVVEATPVAAINTNPAIVCLNDSAAYVDASTIAVGAITNWEWIFDDGTTSTLQNPKHLWLSTGNHTAKLVVRSTGGCTSDTATHTINVNALPTAGFRYGLNCTTRTITLTDTSNGNGRTITGWTWTFGDGGTSAVQNPTHIYATSGTDTVTLSVTTANGCKSPVPDTIIVTIAASPVADFTLPGNTCLPSASPQFVNNTTISDGSALTYIWNFGETPSVDYNAPADIPVSPTHLFTTVGPFDVTLTAISDKGCTNSITKRYSAIYEKPAAIITAPTGVCLGNATNFSSTASTTPGSTAAGWAWDFGDSPIPGSSSVQNPTYTYVASGPKTVKLTVTSAAGCVSNDTTVSFSVNLSPVANFTYDAIRCEDSVITFTDASTPNGSPLVEWKWDFAGTLLTQTAQAPATNTFITSGPKNVSLVVKDANGCSNGTPFALSVIINPNPVADFSVSDICVGTGLANFTQNVSLASGQINVWDWDFDVPGSTNGNTATPSFTYTAGGEYDVKLTATSDSSCKASVTKLVKAFTAPTTAFDVNTPTTLCSNLPVGIIDRSAVAGYGAVDKIEIYWDNLGSPSTRQIVNAPGANSTYTNAYPEFGTPATKPYQILIRAFNGPGCSTDLTQDISVLASPQVQFTQPAPICQEAPSFILTGASDIFGLPGSGAYSGDGVSSDNFTPALAGAGTHAITYTYTAANGCIDAESKDIVVDPTPIINFGNQPVINVLEGDVLQLKPTITYGATYLWTPSTYLNSTTSPTPSGMPTDDIVYTLLVTSNKGCQETQSIPVKVVRKYVVPNTFTPNNDNNHDRWEIENLALYPDVRVRIFSRAGQMVFESYGYNTPWDGKYKGTDCPFGTYYYVIETGGGRGPRTGYVAIIR
ncbi:MAG: PKD domain-containing protein [Bacteroidota bacterium]